MQTLSADEATRNQFIPFRFRGDALLGLWRRREGWRRPLGLVLAQLALASGSYALSLAAIADLRGRFWPLQIFGQTFGLLLILRLASLLLAGLHRRSPSYANVLDVIPILQAVGLSSALFWLLTRAWLVDFAIPAAVFLLDAAFLVLLWCGLHFGGRLWRARRAAARKAGKPVIIVGAGDAGVAILKELTLDTASSCRPVAVVDDDRLKWGRSIFGVRIAGGTKDLARIVAESGAREILVCIPSATRAQMRDILCGCRFSNIPVRVLPSISQLADGKVSRQDFRRPRIEDLLQRDELEIEPRETQELVDSKTVLVTGAGGSIGSELCRQIARAHPRKLLLLDKSENSLFYVHLETSQQLGAARVDPLLIDLLQKDRLREAIQKQRPDIVFHAAAHKHVGLLEAYPQEAIRNNVLGTRNLVEAALVCDVQRFINISSDKAVNPKSYMGLSKRLTEIYIQEIARQTGARFSNVRFGNVAGSTGSVLRLFWDQIQKGEPLRVTDPHAARYFMTIPEAVHLILRAAALSKGGETFIFDMGEPLNIYELARTMMLFAGLRPDEDLRIEFTGLRPGEKVAEELWESSEYPVATDCQRIFAIRQWNPRSCGILDNIRQLELLIAARDDERLLQLLNQLAPEFRPNEHSSNECPVLTAASAEAPEAA